jgi:hypothetical protein
VRVFTAIALLTAVPIIILGVGVAIVGESAKIPATIGLAITLPQSILTFLAVVRVSRWKPEAGPVVVLAGTSLRMVWAVGVIAFLQSRNEAFGSTMTLISQWTTGFYLLTLAFETGLLWKLLSGPVQTHGSPSDGHSLR